MLTSRDQKQAAPSNVTSRGRRGKLCSTRLEKASVRAHVRTIRLPGAIMRRAQALFNLQVRGADAADAAARPAIKNENEMSWASN